MKLLLILIWIAATLFNPILGVLLGLVALVVVLAFLLLRSIGRMLS